ncbi:MAG: phosphoglucosamine mutase [Candidatus Marinimicrobia bacterium]|nr:phosphoglucosamine mutase [Candidatus Neomarinimicrobiota bacterium]MCF7830122.1 phosphoglucosamine mutase [Candidatus Neomarinimicrobiota bacterium]MCF7882491.1 phosphoglucosamine mutase [Candidatus Neomarinimicrobiota bacterium]
MPKDLIESISGIRGIVGTGLTPQSIVNYISAFAHWVDGPRVVVGRDSRQHGLLIRQLVIATLRAKGIEVCDIGITPTPTAQLMTEHLNADGGIMITASHNPEQWNGLKFINADGMFLDATQVEEMFSILRNGEYTFEKWDRIGDVREIHGAIDEHIESILDLSIIQPKKIAKRKFRVVVDAVNGAGSIALPALLEELGCEVLPINCVPNGRFPHEPEPLPENLTQLSEEVKRQNADLGIVVDPDADRCGLVDGDGKYLVEEYTLVMAVDTVLAQLQSQDSDQMDKPVVTNLSTTLAVDKIAEKYGAEVVRTPVGEINVATRMADLDALIGGEGNGGVILAESHLGRDSLVASALVLQRLTDLDTSIREYFESLPRFVMSKEKLDIGDSDPRKMLSQIQEESDSAEIDLQDGVKFTWSDRWVHIRTSNTEPIIRVYGEAGSKEKADELTTKYLNRLKELASD